MLEVHCQAHTFHAAPPRCRRPMRTTSDTSSTHPARCEQHPHHLTNFLKVKFALQASFAKQPEVALQVQVTDPKALERIRQEEMDISMRRIRKILDAGANVILTTKGIDDFCLKAFVEAGCIACRRVDKGDMKRIARATGAQVRIVFSSMLELRMRHTCAASRLASGAKGTSHARPARRCALALCICLWSARPFRSAAASKRGHEAQRVRDWHASVQLVCSPDTHYARNQKLDYMHATVVLNLPFVFSAVTSSAAGCLAALQHTSALHLAPVCICIMKRRLLRPATRCASAREP